MNQLCVYNGIVILQDGIIYYGQWMERWYHLQGWIDDSIYQSSDAFQPLFAAQGAVYISPNCSISKTAHVDQEAQKKNIHHNTCNRHDWWIGSVARNNSTKIIIDVIENRIPNRHIPMAQICKAVEEQLDPE